MPNRKLTDIERRRASQRAGGKVRPSRGTRSNPGKLSAGATKVVGGGTVPGNPNKTKFSTRKKKATRKKSAGRKKAAVKRKMTGLKKAVARKTREIFTRGVLRDAGMLRQGSRPSDFDRRR